MDDEAWELAAIEAEEDNYMQYLDFGEHLGIF